MPEGTNLLEFTNQDDYLFDYFSTESGQADAALDPDRGLTQYGQGPLMPYYMLDWRTRATSQFFGEFIFISPVWANNSASGIVRNQMSLGNLNNVDLVLTSDKDLWSRCVVVETANRFYIDAGFQTEITADDSKLREQFDLRGALSVGKEAGEDGLPLPDGELDENGNPQVGMGWFPGYAVDVETGQRLNVFWGENSVYDGSLFPESFTDGATGRDMMLNPNSQLLLEDNDAFNAPPYPAYLGGQHMIYISKVPYDSCQIFRENLKVGPSPLTKIKAMA